MSRADTAPDHHSFWHDPVLPFIEARAVQDGRRVCYDKHSHPHFSIGAITGGHSHYLNQRSRQEVGRGHLVLMNPEEVHACNPVADEPWSYLMFYLDTGWLQRQQEEAGLGDAFRPFDMTASRDPLLYQGLCRLHRQLWREHEPLAREVACHQFSRQLLARLTPASWDDRPPQHLQRAAELMQDDCCSPLTLAQLSAVAGLTPSHFVRSFSRHYGMTPHAYLLDQRIRHARALLRRGEPLAEVALASGFADQAHFQRQFKRRVAATPGHYRTQLTRLG
ncbi:helix-turn-helix transcriptional regulator [Aeromonas hydrophila]|uniref:helix-turn-helix transcriptional regulator n=1 Tax=Aeromonas hydrophila TaxID=644 RepID=UPI000332B7C1|nr:AraC family transcriptional regulator [Aeromonas hydrophila]AGM41899.1 AraC family transcriptional regulator [Aeromonas hydrophila ML09-119]AHX30640.1 AraC family transcriptional regulator [Aeromonas hydrophila subsp. hydrophila AL09-71]AHX67436.1 AraC family transcriptional regulator [Aeromonas hydrophila pc104A]AJE38506.1 AraC family transcriptional regulator [Aeromonas hydrophila J-1]AKJ36802.1 AraC family transcriptional regulator [Aeromonas hydrophila NJ-35]